MTEYKLRKKNFREQKKKIDALNANKDDDAVYAINYLSDLSQEEFKALLGAKAPSGNASSTPVLSGLLSAPANPPPSSVDWTNQTGISTPVKNQGQCGSCWAFAAIAAQESAVAIKSKSLKLLSAQEYVDCTTVQPYDNAGCDGGWYTDAWSYAKDKKGISTQANYPYTARDGSCKPKGTKVGKISGYTSILPNTEAIKIAVAK